jgi:PiT family inorganic phosphate transporter
VLIAIGCGIFTMLLGIFLIKRIKLVPTEDEEFRFTNVEKIFGVLMVFTACGMAFAHGSNDVANAVGPVAAIISIVNTGAVSQTSSLSTWILLLGGVGIVLGLATYGWRVIRTVGRNITELTPSRGFAAELAAACTVVLASGTGLPISTTQTLVGAVLGVGMARGIGAINLGVVRNIVVSWVVTLPVGAALSIMFFWMIKGAFS